MLAPSTPLPRAFSAVLLVAAALACSPESPVSPDGSPLMSMAASDRVPISGSIVSTLEEGAAEVIVTPSLRCHSFDSPGHTMFEGDVEGPVVFRRRISNLPCTGPDGPGDRLTGSGPYDGTVTFQGRTGMISGQWTTECRPDSESPAGWSCDGTMTARGSGDLDGVHFRFDWGPGWFPLPYTGTAVITR